MGISRIKDLPSTNYNSSYKLAVDDETNGTRSISLSQIPDTNTTYSFANGSNGFTVTPSNGSPQTVTVTPSIPNVTTTKDGLMSLTDKIKLDGIHLVVCTQAEYDASAKLDGWFYFIKES